MNPYQVFILPSAERNINEAYQWLARQNEEAACRWYNQLLGVIFSLEVLPERCPLAPESKFLKTEIREIFHGRRQHKYRVLFIVRDDEIHVLHVRHGARLAFGESEPVE